MWMPRNLFNTLHLPVTVAMYYDIVVLCDSLVLTSFSDTPKFLAEQSNTIRTLVVLSIRTTGK